MGKSNWIRGSYLTGRTRVSKSESHGCVRLTNCDVGLLGKNVKEGTPAILVESPKADKNG
jgi:lipoprotein-anchoring transpeptidase ErfK/SrfK